MKYLLLTTIIGLSACVQHQPTSHISCPRLVAGQLIEGECKDGLVHSRVLDRGDKPADPPSDPVVDDDEEVNDSNGDNSNSSDSNGDNSDGDYSDDSNKGNGKGKGEGRKDHKKR